MDIVIDKACQHLGGYPERIGRAWDKTPALVRAAAIGGIVVTTLSARIALRDDGFFNDVVLVPIFEEIYARVIFHGIISCVQTALGTRNPDMATLTSRRDWRIRIATVLWIANHSIAVLPLLQHFFALGPACGILYEQKQSMLYPIMQHMAHNFIATTTRMFERAVGIPIPLLYIPLTLPLHLYTISRLKSEPPVDHRNHRTATPKVRKGIEQSMATSMPSTGRVQKKK